MSLRSFGPEILEAMEACRPGSDDVSRPEMAALSARLAASPALDRTYKRLQKLDGALVLAFRDVPVPEGLGDRILAAIAADAGESASHAAGVAPTVWRNTTGRRKTTRRVALGAMASAVAAALVAAVVWPYWHRPISHDPEAILSAAITFANNDPCEGGLPWPQTADALAREYPISAIAGRYPRIQWRPIRGFLNRDGAAYDITSREGIRATLYVVGASGEGLPGEPAGLPYPAGRRCATAWRENGLLYVLVVWGDQRDYERFLAPAHGTGPVA
jgi:hypothetical protein